MSIHRYKPMPSSAKTFYGITDKELVKPACREEREACMVRDLIKNEYGMEPVTIPQLAHGLLGRSPHNWSYYEVSDAMKNAKEWGYLESARLQNKEA